MEQHGATGKDQQWPTFDEDRPTGDCLRSTLSRLRPACPLMVNGVSRNRQHRGGRERCEEWHKEEYGERAETPANRPCRDGNRHVARVIEGRVSPQATGQVLRPEEPERDRRHGWSEHVAGDRH